jgi:beta-glucosidase/6-phospho-beta-glucosidase/beta-galactosidase
LFVPFSSQDLDFQGHMSWFFMCLVHDPYTFVYGGYGRKDMAPGINGPAKTVYKAATNVLQSHAAAFRLYKKRYEAAQKG